MDAYFENLYWIPCLGIFHPDTTYRQIHVKMPLPLNLPDMYADFKLGGNFSSRPCGCRMRHLKLLR